MKTSPLSSSGQKLNWVRAQLPRLRAATSAKDAAEIIRLMADQMVVARLFSPNTARCDRIYSVMHYVMFLNPWEDERLRQVREIVVPGYLSPATKTVLPYV